MHASELACWDTWESLGTVEVARTIKDKSLIVGSAMRLSPVFVVVYILDLCLLFRTIF